MPWNNNDGLNVKFGTEEAAIARGGQTVSHTGSYESQITVDFRDMLSATPAILGSVAGPDIVGSFGVMIPKGLLVEEIDIVVETAFTSSGTIGSATFVTGLVREDQTTAFDDDGISAAAATGTVLGLATAGSKTVLRRGSTGAGALVGTILANDGLFMVSNSAHATHPFTAGKARVTVRGYFPNP